MDHTSSTCNNYQASLSQPENIPEMNIPKQGCDPCGLCGSTDHKAGACNVANPSVVIGVRKTKPNQTNYQVSVSQPQNIPKINRPIQQSKQCYSCGSTDHIAANCNVASPSVVIGVRKTKPNSGKRKMTVEERKKAKEWVTQCSNRNITSVNSTKKQCTSVNSNTACNNCGKFGHDRSQCADQYYGVGNATQESQPRPPQQYFYPPPPLPPQPRPPSFPSQQLPQTQPSQALQTSLPTQPLTSTLPSQQLSQTQSSQPHPQLQPLTPTSLSQQFSTKVPSLPLASSLPPQQLPQTQPSQPHPQSQPLTPTSLSQQFSTKVPSLPPITSSLPPQQFPQTQPSQPLSTSVSSQPLAPHEQTLLCTNCGKSGHHFKDCTNLAIPKPSQKCGENGHLAEECIMCKWCGKNEHQTEACPLGPYAFNLCFKCGGKEHVNNMCQGSFCKKCKTPGHVEDNCKANKVTKVDVTNPFTSQAYTLSAWAGLRTELSLPIAIATNHMSMRCTQYRIANINNCLNCKRNYEKYITALHALRVGL